jgi:broad specificity phosphatase PhoE
MLLYLIRSAQELHDANYTASRNFELSILGKLQADRLAQVLSQETLGDNAFLFTSPMRNALLTAGLVGKATSLTPQVWYGLYEENNRNYMGLARTTILRDFPNYIVVEDLLDEVARKDFKRRIYALISDLSVMRWNGVKTILLVSHNKVLSELLSTLLKQHIGHLAHASITKVDVSYWRQPRLVSWSNVDHLKDTEVTY